jgi:hypothetical protein
MTVIPPVLLVLDLSILSATTTRDWMGFSRVGICHIPKIIDEEMHFLHDRAPDPELERVARDFRRFFKESNWKVSEGVSYHPMLKSSTGEAYTKRVRLALAVSRAAYSLSLENPTKLVVLAVSDRNLQQKIYDMQIPNLCAINSPTLLQWSQTGQRPIAVIQKIQQMRSGGLLPTAATRGNGSTRIQQQTRVQSGYPRSRPHSQIPQAYVETPRWMKDLVAIALALGALVVAGVVVWFLINHANSQYATPQQNTRTVLVDPPISLPPAELRGLSPYPAIQSRDFQ